MVESLPPGTVAVLSGDQTRWAWFSQSLVALQARLSRGSTILWCQGLWISEAVNTLIASMQGDWICLLADDHRFMPDLVQRLVAHNLDIVAPLCYLRRLPYYPSLFQERQGEYRGYTHDDLHGKTGLLPVDAMGGPGVVIRRHVLEKMDKPYFESHPQHRVVPHEDLWFFSKARAAGFQPYVDLDTQIGHVTPAVVYPYRDTEGQYGVRLWSGADIALLDTSTVAP